MNQVLLMGRLAEQFRTDESGLRTVMKLEIVRDDDNSVNSEACIIPVMLWRGLGDILQEKSQVGDVFAVKGSISVTNDRLMIIAERVSTIKENKA
ncbi:MAG: single-stranded DNA-binding protein [Erysipelotrichaceae bacterium]|jgi:single-stranded DNA-binding protein|nr:single-stranded DNA-binding protein [Erysipelotrichaceae bacterium]MBR2826013.1 single-stranded DNA-binding protein [Erysipelotrichaceae bacterium]